MSQGSNRIVDDLTRFMTDAAGMAQGARREVDTIMRGQAERFVRSIDAVPREEFEAVKLMAQKAREENEALSQRLAALEARLAKVAPVA